METPYRILLVDDDVLLTSIFDRVMKLAGYSVTVINHAAGAVAAAQTLRPDLILLDFNLQGVKGAEILAQIRRTAGIEQTRIAFLSGGPEPLEYLDQTTSFISKPVGLEALLDATRYLLGGGCYVDANRERLVA